MTGSLVGWSATRVDKEESWDVIVDGAASGFMDGIGSCPVLVSSGVM